MQTVSSLTEVQVWLTWLIAKEHIELKCPQADDRADHYTLAAPAVHIGYIPPKAELNSAGGIRIPCLVVGVTESAGDEDNTTLDLQITAVVWDPGIQSPAEQEGQTQLAANFDGYITLLNILDRVKLWVQREDGIAERFQLESAVRLKTYEEQPWPYWYGSLSFTVSGSPDPKTRYADALN